MSQDFYQILEIQRNATETEIKKANFAENKKWFKPQNLVSVLCPITAKFHRGQFTNSPNMTKNYQSIRFFDLGTVQIVSDKYMAVLKNVRERPKIAEND